MTEFSVEIQGPNMRLAADRALERAIAAVSEQALKDCNYYCKQDMGALIQSSLTHSNFEKGELKWVTPYAEKQYYLPAACKDKNPNASPHWCEKAEENHSDEWEIIFRNALRREGL